MRTLLLPAGNAPEKEQKKRVVSTVCGVPVKKMMFFSLFLKNPLTFELLHHLLFKTEEQGL